MNNQEISVTTPVRLAYDRMKLMLFQPFDLGKWFVIGFCAWLAGLGESGGGLHGGYGFNKSHTQDMQHFQAGLVKAMNYLMHNLYWIIPAAAAALVFLLALGMAILWLNSRGKFMFLHCIALNQAEVAAPWQKFARIANSLFWFRFLVGLAGAIVSMPLLVAVGIIILRMIRRGEPEIGGIMLAAGLVLGFCLLAVVLALIQKFTVDFIVPIMFLRGEKCCAAWKEFGKLLAAYAGHFALYILFQILLTIAIGVILLFAILLTCCIAGCLMAIPYIGTVVVLPVLVFKRSYSAYFLAQFGPVYDVFSPEPPTPPTGFPPMPAPPPAS